ncbi:MAG TPA: YbfB/YjiJ family MFS transporter [Burkholderiaceae bacterium]|nr:YbfB/YjiJ family MFS transporter [Burkholderiaceae bacterium]
MPTQSSAARVCLAGFLALVVAMGIGRFAFTPLLPLMQADGQIDLRQGAWLATANYLGYLAGAMTIARLRMDPKTLIRISAPLLAVLTAGMSATGQMLPWLMLRFAAGVLSAWVLVGVSAWCLAELAKAGRAAWSGTVYAGVGAGIALAGLFCLAGSGLKIPAADLWWQLGAGAALLCVAIVLLVPPAGSDWVPPQAAASQPGRPAGPQHRGLVVCYGCFGFGYILPATFLPALARATLDDPALFGWSWPVFGIAAAISTLLAGTLFAKTPRVRLWATCQLLMAAGAALPGLWPAPASVLLSAVLVGGTFMVITMAGMQEARARAGANATKLLGQMTAAFALGQIAGPVASALLGYGFAGALDGVRFALLIAAAVLAASGWWLLRAQTQAFLIQPTGVSK